MKSESLVYLSVDPGHLEYPWGLLFIVLWITKAEYKLHNPFLGFCDFDQECGGLKRPQQTGLVHDSLLTLRNIIKKYLKHG